MTPDLRVQVGKSTVPNDQANFKISLQDKLTLIAGPCQMESRDHSFMIIDKLLEVTQHYNVPFVFKASFDKANRTNISGVRGLGLEKSLEVFYEIKEHYNIPITTDVHEIYHVDVVKPVVDIIQIPAFLSRQTDLLIEAAKSDKVVNVKKGQFLAPWDMKNVIEKINASGNNKVLLTERGVTFGYNSLVVDMRSLPIMAEMGVPVVFDATHSVQAPGGKGTSSGGERKYVEVLAKAAVATGHVAAVFLECHQDPDNAPSDGANMLHLDSVEPLLEKLLALKEAS